MSVREAIAHGTLRPTDKTVVEVAGRWDQLVRFAALRMGRQLGIEVQPGLSRKELADPAARAQTLVDSLLKRGVLEGGLRIPNAVGPVQITADIRTSRLTASVEIEAPREGRPATRINWLLRQLKDASDGVRLDAFALHSRTATSALLKEARNKPEILLDDPKKELRTFRVALSAPMGTKRSQGRGSFVQSILDLVDEFYRTVVQNLKPWSAAPPKLRPELVEVAEPGVPTQLVSTAISSQDDMEAAMGSDVSLPPTWHPDPGEESSEDENGGEVQPSDVGQAEPGCDSDPQPAPLPAEAAWSMSAEQSEPEPKVEEQSEGGMRGW